MKLYTYCLRFDDGAAPNPYWGLCTLVICKPAIRRTAVVGDWVVGLGSANSPVGNISNCVVYAMKVTEKMSMAEYDDFCRRQFPRKIPKWGSRYFRERMGDCIYDFSAKAAPGLRESVHSEANRERDLGGKNALISRHFFYFGDHPVKLPDHLRPIMHTTQGHKSGANAEYLGAFVEWIEGLGYCPNQLHGKPQLKREYACERDVRA